MDLQKVWKQNMQEDYPTMEKWDRKEKDHPTRVSLRGMPLPPPPCFLFLLPPPPLESFKLMAVNNGVVLVAKK